MHIQKLSGWALYYIFLIPLSSLPVVVQLTLILPIIGLYAFPGYRNLRLSPLAFWVLFGLIISLGINFIIIDFNAVVVKQSNHFLQFIALFPLLVQCFRGAIPELLRVASKLNTLCFLAFLVLMKTLFNGVTGKVFLYHEFDPLMMILFVSALLVFSKQPKAVALTGLLIFAVFIMTITERMVYNYHLLILFIFWMGFLGNIWVILAGITILISIPIIAYMLPSEVIGLIYLWDPNTGIRIDFIRGALSLIVDNPTTGVGFGTPYRDVGFSYFGEHGLLDSSSRIVRVPNHNSIVDTVLRLGFPLATMLFALIFVNGPRKGFEPLWGFLVLSVCYGLSFDAWFEAQSELITFLAALSLIYTIQRTPLDKKSHIG